MQSGVKYMEKARVKSLKRVIQAAGDKSAGTAAACAPPPPAAGCLSTDNVFISRMSHQDKVVSF